MHISGVSFSSREDPSGILVSINGSGGGAMQYWELLEQERAIHSLFSTSSATSRFLEWKCLSVFNSNSRIISICPSRNVWVSGPEVGTHPQHHLVIATSSGDLICINKENMKQVITSTTFDVYDLIIIFLLNLDWTFERY